MSIDDDRMMLELAIRTPPESGAARVHFMQVLWRAVVVVPSASRASSLQEAQPVMYPAPQGQCLAAFTSPEAAAVTRSYAPFMIAIDGGTLISTMNPVLGLALASADGVSVLDAEFLAAVRSEPPA